MAELLAGMLESEGDVHSARTFRGWARAEDAMFALAWVQCVGVRA